MRKREKGGGRGGLGRNDVADSCRKHGRAWHGGDGSAMSRDRIGLLCHEVRDEVRKLTVKGDVKLLPSPLAGLRLLLQLSVHAGVLRVRAPPALLFHLDSSIHGNSSRCGVHVSVTVGKY